MPLHASPLKRPSDVASVTKRHQVCVLQGSIRLRGWFEVAALRDAIDVAVGSTKVHPRYVVLTIPEDRPRDDGHARRPKFLRRGGDVVGEELDHRSCGEVRVLRGTNTSALLPSSSWKTQTSSPLWLKRRLKTLRKKSAIASGFSVRVPTHPIFDNLTDDLLHRLPDPLSEPVA